MPMNEQHRPKKTVLARNATVINTAPRRPTVVSFLYVCTAVHHHKRSRMCRSPLSIVANNHDHRLILDRNVNNLRLHLTTSTTASYHLRSFVIGNRSICRISSIDSTEGTLLFRRLPPPCLIIGCFLSPKCPKNSSHKFVQPSGVPCSQ